MKLEQSAQVELWDMLVHLPCQAIKAIPENCDWETGVRVQMGGMVFKDSPFKIF